jgi:hypothetical protein
LDGNHALRGQAVVARSYDDRGEIEDSTLTMYVQAVPHDRKRAPALYRLLQHRLTDVGKWVPAMDVTLTKAG